MISDLSHAFRFYLNLHLNPVVTVLNFLLLGADRFSSAFLVWQYVFHLLIAHGAGTDPWNCSCEQRARVRRAWGVTMQLELKTTTRLAQISAL
jgi:hypothetical protein